ncbi:hypothetical protein TL16_g03072 [Triparma laevis f. inornata]|uniref:Uncharacterized protein n=1 Tax=Triparma laevis f. inornata TaxID=1714386 RepID=A0A9W7E074_9STRA|nr:hypothetical protein TL16_g03072 [Triparma laevis f. inornata]
MSASECNHLKRESLLFAVPRSRTDEMKTLIKRLAAHLHPEKCAIEVPNQDAKVPSDFEAFYRESLKADLADFKNNLKNVTDDNLNHPYQNAPRRWKKYNGADTDSFWTDGFFSKFDSKSLDPFNRFFRTSDTFENSAKRYSSDSEGLMLETYLAHQVLKRNKSCHNCGKVALRWAGGSAGPWKDIVCTSCKAVYEVKAKNSITKFNGSSTVGCSRTVNGGSLKAFCSLPDDVEKYLIILKREDGGDRRGEGESVVLSKIKNVKAKLTGRTFTGGGFSTTIDLKPLEFMIAKNVRFFTHWFRLEELGRYDQVWRERVVREVFAEVFPLDEVDWDGFKARRLAAEPATETAQETTVVVPNAAEVVIPPPQLSRFTTDQRKEADDWEVLWDEGENDGAEEVGVEGGGG